MKSTLTSVLESKSVIDSIQSSRRWNSRSLTEFRPLNIEFRSEPGQVCVSLGKTRILAQISNKIVKPKETRGNIGIVRIHASTSKIPLVSVGQSKHKDYSQMLNEILDFNICQTECVDLESLCIQAGEYVWSIKINLNVLNYDGNLLDCANLAALCALVHNRIPYVSLRNSKFHVFSEAERESYPLRVHHLPIITTFGYFPDQSNTMIIDPDEFEEYLLSGTLSISYNQHRQICGIHTFGNLSLEREQIEACKCDALVNAFSMTHRIHEALKQHWNLRGLQNYLLSINRHLSNLNLDGRNDLVEGDQV